MYFVLQTLESYSEFKDIGFILLLLMNFFEFFSINKIKKGTFLSLTYVVRVHLMQCKTHELPHTNEL